MLNFQDVCTDTRQRMDGALFVALIGDNFDAHEYTSTRLKKWEQQPLLSVGLCTTNLPTLLVDDTQTALADIAHWHLNNIKPTVVAITGSNGKTTTKNMLANILSLKAPTLATKGNLNNHLGVPMTLLTLEQESPICRG